MAVQDWLQKDFPMFPYLSRLLETPVKPMGEATDSETPMCQANQP
jgi:hypothetical protein